MPAFPAHLVVLVLCAVSVPSWAVDTHPPIPIPFNLREPAFVTLVIEDGAGNRVRNLLSETPFPAGDNVAWWDGLDDVGRDPQAAKFAVYHIPGKVVPPGKYRVRGLVRPEINLHYEFTPYNEGNPPWRTADRGSEWLANHTPPSAVLFVPESKAPQREGKPAPGGQVLVGSYVSEGGSGLAWLNLHGRKLHGQMWIGGVWTGASHLARDAGDRAVPGVYAYTAAAWKGDKYNGYRRELRLFELVALDQKGEAPRDTRFGTGEDRPVITPTHTIPDGPPELATRPLLGGIAAHNGLIVASLPTRDEVVFIDGVERKVLGAATLADPRGLAFDAQGRLLAISGTKVVRYPAMATDGPGVVGTRLAGSVGNTIISSNLLDPQQLALDAVGNLYITDRGESHQVKVFSAGGKFLRAIGEPGKPGIGPYNPRHMNNPNGLTITGDGKLWVAETEHSPKRVSIWSLDGRLLNALYGPPAYGGGGCLDSQDKTRFFYAGMEFKLDWATGKSVPVSVFYRGELDPVKLFRSGVPETPLHVNGMDYLTNCYTSNPTGGYTNVRIWRLRDGVATPVAGIGRASDWREFNAIPPFTARWTGQIMPAFSEEYTFTVQAEGGQRLWVAGKQVVDNWNNQYGKNTGTVALEAGKRHDIRLEYIYRTGTPTVKLQWESASQKRQSVPTAALFPTAEAGPTGTGLAATYFEDLSLTTIKETRIDSKVDFTWNTKPPFAVTENPFRASFPKEGEAAKGPITIVWSDLNADGQLQPEEITSRPGDPGSVSVMGDLSLVTASGVLLKPSRFTRQGVPVYDAAQAEVLVTDTQRPVSSGGGQALLGKDGRLVLTTAPKPFSPFGMGGVLGGKPVWSYPSCWPGLHASHNAPLAEFPGQMLGTTRLLGLPISPRNSDAGEIWAINGNFGQVYLMTTDGLFVATLFKDCRKASWSFPEAKRNMLVNDASLHAENFWPSITQTPDGKVYLQVHNTHLVRVEGLEGVRRIPEFSIDVSAQQLAEAQVWFREQEALRQQAQQAPRKLTVALGTEPIVVDGKLDEWKDAQWVTIDERVTQVGDWGHRKRANEAAVAISGDRLYVALKSDDPRVLNNSGDSVRHLFKTGGAVDLMLGTDPKADPARKSAVAGDVRLVVTQVKGKPVAVLYRPVATGVTTEPILFSSPLRTLAFAQVEDVTAQVQLALTVEYDEKAKVETGLIEVSAPLALLGLQPVAGMTLRGDIGLLRGNGFQTFQRAYWSNKASGIVSDEPSEAELLPQLWGEWEVR